MLSGKRSSSFCFFFFFFFFFFCFSRRDKDQVTGLTHPHTHDGRWGGAPFSRPSVAALFSHGLVFLFSPFCIMLPLPLPFRLFLDASRGSLLGDPDSNFLLGTHVSSEAFSFFSGSLFGLRLDSCFLSSFVLIFLRGVGLFVSFVRPAQHTSRGADPSSNEAYPTGHRACPSPE